LAKNVYRFLLLVIISISLLCMFVRAPSALAQETDEPTGFKNVQLWLYPEYDDPRLLVMLEGKIVGVEPPTKVRFLVPYDAEMYSAGSMDAQGQYSGGPPARQASTIAGWDEISYELKTETFRVEYYAPHIIENPNKSIEYEFRSLFPISGLSVVVQQPLQSSNFTVQPTGKLTVDQFNNIRFNAYQYQFDSIMADTPLNFQISYSKTDMRTSIEIQAAGSVPENNDSLPSSTVMLILVIVPLVVLVTGIFLVLIFRQKSSPRRRNKVRTSPAPKASKQKRHPNRVCEECGASIPRTFRYCPHCGQERD
jgi:hypothetical protein